MNDLRGTHPDHATLYTANYDTSRIAVGSQTMSSAAVAKHGTWQAGQQTEFEQVGSATCAATVEEHQGNIS
jgi:hypothetical protein